MAWNNPTPYKQLTTSPKIELDPSAPGTMIRYAMGIEVLFNLSTLPLILSPYSVLSSLTSTPSHITPLTELLARVFGSVVVGALTPALLFGIPNTRQAIESRRPVYKALGLGELSLIPLFLLEALGSGERAMDPTTAWLAAANMAVLVAWRGYCLFVKPEFFGRYREAKKEE